MSIVKKLLCTSVLLLLMSCGKDYNNVGGHIVGENHFDFDLYDKTKVIAFNTETGAVQTNNLAINKLGVYHNPIFGKLTASYVSQLSLVTTGPDLGSNPVVEEVILYIPYFATLQSTDSDGNNTYKLDSIYGNSKIKLEVYESKYFMNDYDPLNISQRMKYFSNEQDKYESNHNPKLLNNNSEKSQNEEFVFSPSEYLIYKDEKVSERIAPGMRLKLDIEFFKDKIFSPEAQSKLVNNNIFKDYFRGLYFKVTNASSDPNGESMMMMPFGKGTITIKYTTDSANGENKREEKNLILHLGFDSTVATRNNNTVNLYKNEFSTLFTNAISSANPILGDEKLFVKGGEGSIVYIDLFDDTEIKELKDQKWIINEANISFYIDENTMNSTREPLRLYLYDAKYNTPIVDYQSDNSANTNDRKLDKSIYGGIIEKDNNGKGTRYKIRLTNHINNIINKDSTNVRLGLVVTENINDISNTTKKNVFESLDKIPAASVMNPLGTILYGNTGNIPENKKLKLEIYYTKSK